MGQHSYQMLFFFHSPFFPRLYHHLFLIFILTSTFQEYWGEGKREDLLVGDGEGWEEKE